MHGFLAQQPLKLRWKSGGSGHLPQSTGNLRKISLLCENLKFVCLSNKVMQFQTKGGIGDGH